MITVKELRNLPIKKWYKEIRAVGFVDWFWFVNILKRNEFHSKLDLGNFIIKGGSMEELMGARDRAHKIDMTLTDLK